eukprot:3736511-Pleurochrysis_carterae.AAC.1
MGPGPQQPNALAPAHARSNSHGCKRAHVGMRTRTRRTGALRAERARAQRARSRVENRLSDVEDRVRSGEGGRADSRGGRKGQYKEAVEVGELALTARMAIEGGLDDGREVERRGKGGGGR